MSVKPMNKKRRLFYSCNYRKHDSCKKHFCQKECQYTTNYNYAYKTPTNFIKRFINIINGYEKVR